MGLVDLKTNLKSLKYGRDLPGGGSSNEPYIQKDSESKDLGSNGGTDFLLRGGSKAISRSADDVSRLTKYFFDFKSFKGAAFTLKQNLLSKSQADIRGGLIGNNPFTINGGVYTPLSTISQAGVNAFGFHLNKQGLNPFNGTLTQVSDFISDKLNLNLNSGLITSVSLPKYSDFYGRSSITKSRLYTIALTKNYIYSNTNSTPSIPSNVIYEYNGGPDSVLGVGKTKIHFSSKERTNNIDPSVGKKENFTGVRPTPTVLNKGIKKLSGLNLDEDVTAENLYNFGNNKNTIPKDFLNTGSVPTKLTTEKDINPEYVTKETPQIIDFRTLKNPKLMSWMGMKDMYAKISTEGETSSHGRIYLNDPTDRKKSLLGSGISENDFTNSPYVVDVINASLKSTREYDDLVKFRIGAFNRIQSKWEWVTFRAFIDSFSDDYSAEWSDEKFMGRGEKFYKYRDFNRKINMSWTIAAQSVRELIPMYKKLNYVASLLAPNYGSNGYMSGTMCQLTVGGYVYETPGIINSLQISVPEESPWEIGLKYNSAKEYSESTKPKSWDHDTKELPMILKVTGFSFTPIHKFTPQFQYDRYQGDSRFISLATGGGNPHNNYDTLSEYESNEIKK